MASLADSAYVVVAGRSALIGVLAHEPSRCTCRPSQPGVEGEAGFPGGRRVVAGARTAAAGGRPQGRPLGGKQRRVLTRTPVASAVAPAIPLAPVPFGRGYGLAVRSTASRYRPAGRGT